MILLLLYLLKYYYQTLSVDSTAETKHTLLSFFTLRFSVASFLLSFIKVHWMFKMHFGIDLI